MRRHRPGIDQAPTPHRPGTDPAIARHRPRTDPASTGIDSGAPSGAPESLPHARDGAPIGFTELAHPAYHLLYEYEGDHHRTSREQWLRDLEKHAAYVAEGYELVRLGANHIRPPHPQGAKIVRAVLARRGWTG